MQRPAPLLCLAASLCLVSALPRPDTAPGLDINTPGLHSSVTQGHHASHGSIGSSISSVGSIGHHGSHGLTSSISSGYIPSTPIVSTPIVHSAPVVHSSGSHHQDYNEKPDPFSFEYGVHDDHYHTDFSEHRSGDTAGNIVGEYSVALPDGRVQHVKYTADGHYGGTVMEVSYQGEARHPEPVHIQPVVHEVHNIAPSYHA